LDQELFVHKALKSKLMDSFLQKKFEAFLASVYLLSKFELEDIFLDIRSGFFS